MVNQKTNKCQKISNCSLLFICVFVYLIWMDVALYIKLQQLLPYSQRPKTRPKDGPFSPFEPITMKLLMNCPQEHYIHLPLGNFTKKKLSKKKTKFQNSHFSCMVWRCHAYFKLRYAKHGLAFWPFSWTLFSKTVFVLGLQMEVTRFCVLFRPWFHGRFGWRCGKKIGKFEQQTNYESWIVGICNRYEL